MLLLLAGCGGGNTKSPDTGFGGNGATGFGGNTGSTCPTSNATGTLSVHISGTPSGHGSVSLAGGSTLTVSNDLSLAAGPETITAYLVAEGNQMVRTAYSPVVDVPEPCVRAGQTTIVNVVYSRIASSGALWLGASNTPDGSTLLSYLPAGLASTGSSPAAVAATTGGSDGFTFDVFGNAWVIGGTTADPPVARIPAAALGADGLKTPDIIIDSPSFGTSIPGPAALAFDNDGNLWVSVISEDKVVKIAASALGTPGTSRPAAAVEESGVSAPAGLAFDGPGNLWIASSGASTVVRINAAHLASSGQGADLTVIALSPPPVVGPLSSPEGLAFDADGNLWVNYEGLFARLTPADQAGSGTKTITPGVQIAPDVQSLPMGMAFDEFGGMWFADVAGQFACFGASQLTTSGTLRPQIIISSPDLGYAGWFALYPAPAFTPLAHALP